MPPKATRARTKKTTNGKPAAETASVQPKPPVAAADIDRYEQIRRRAYELYERRGRQHGYHEQDWFQAESELTSRTA